MICVLALIVFSILGIFSASHRKLAKEAFDCVFRRVTLRPCTSGLDQRLKGQILGSLINRSETAARFVNKYFEVLSWSFLVLTLASIFFTAQGAYNYYMYGNCNGLNATGFCAFDPHGDNNKISAVSTECTIHPPTEANLNLSSVNLQEYPVQFHNQDNKLNIVFIGCFSCEYTRKAYPVIKELLQKYPANFTFIHFPVKGNTEYLSGYGYCAYKTDQAKFWQFVDRLFESSIKDVNNPEYADQVLEEVGYDPESIKACANSSETQTIVKNQFNQVADTNIYGTPTIFINGQPLVGPKPKRVYERLMAGGIINEIKGLFK